MSGAKVNQARTSRPHARLAVALGWLLALGVLLLALVMTGLRVGLSQLDQHADWLEQQLGEQLGLDVEIVGLQGRLQGWYPRVSADVVRLAPPAADAAITLRDIKLELDPWRSLLRRFPVAANLSLGASDVDLTLAADGTLGLVGGDVPADMQLSSLADLFYLAGYVHLQESRIRLFAVEDESLYDELWLWGELGHRRGEGRGALGARYRAVVDGEQTEQIESNWSHALRGRPWADPDWQGRLALEGGGGQLGTVLGRLAPAELRLEGPLEQFNLVFSRDPEFGRQLQGEIAMSRLRFAGRAPLHAVELSLEATGIDQADGTARLTRFRAETVGRALELDGTRMTWSAGYPGTWFVELPDVDLGAAAGVIAQVPAFPGGVQRWLAGLAPAGQLRDGRLVLQPETARAWFRGDLERLSLQAFQGVPEVDGVSGTLTAHEAGGWLDIDTGPFSLHFPDLFPSAWNYRGGEGQLLLQLVDGRPQLLGRGLQIRADHVAARADLALDLAAPEALRQLTLMIGIERGQAAAARDYLPGNLPPGLRVWLAEALEGGTVSSGAVLLHAGLAPEAELSRLPQLYFSIADGDLRFAPGWPLARALQGRLGLHHGDFLARIDQGRILAGQLEQMDIAVPARSGQVQLHGRVRGAADDILTTLRDLPLEDHYQLGDAASFTAGEIAADLDLVLDLQAEELLDSLRVGARFEDAAVTIPELELSAEALNGQLEYRHPGELRSEGLVVHALGGNADVRVRQDAPGEIHIGIDGSAEAEAVAEWLAIDWLAGARGTFPYSNETRIRTPGDIDVLVRADTAGLRLGLPPPLTFPGEQLELDLHVPVAGEWELGLQWGSLSGQFGLTGREVRNGTIGYGVEPPERPELGWHVAAEVPGIDLEAWWVWAAGWQPQASETDPAEATERRLRVDLGGDQLLWGDWQLGSGRLELDQEAGSTHLALASQQLAAVLRQSPEQALQLEIEHLRWPFPGNALQAPAEPAPAADPGPLELGWLGAADVSIEELWLDDRLLGALQFELQVAGEELVLDRLSGDLRGLMIGPVGDTPARLIWQGGEHPRTRLQARVGGEDAAEVLQAWGLAPTLEAEQFRVDLDLSWPGLPTAFAPPVAQGQVDLAVERGRFVQFETGTAPLRVVGLFNFAALARRMRLDFTDVYRRGIAFEDIEGVLALDAGSIRTREPLRISGPGSSFRLTGTLDLIAQTLDGDIIVTLPVSENMPWFAAYAVLLANPLAGAGVFFAERVFRDQIDRFSSARYRLRGSFDEPEVSFVSIFPTDPDVPITLPPEEGALAPELDLDWLIELDAPLDWLRPVPLLPSQEDDS